MAITFSCPECSKALQSANPIAPGKKVKCPGCGALFSPRPDDQIEEEERPIRRPRDEEEVENRPHRRRHRDDEQVDDDDVPHRKRRSRTEDDEEEEYEPPRKRKSKGQKSGTNLLLIMGVSGGGVALLILVLTALVWPGFLLSSSSEKGPKGGGGPDTKGGGVADAARKEPDPAFADQLGPARQIDAYEIRLPKGYEQLEAPKLPVGTMYMWAGQQRANNTRPVMTISIVTYPRGQRPGKLSDFMAGFFDSARKPYRNWSQTKPEPGQLSGMGFIRARFSGTLANVELHGLVYAVEDGHTTIAITSQDAEPHHEQTLKLGETAALTLRKK